MLEWTEVRIDRGLTLRLTASEVGVRRIEFHPEDAPVGTRRDGNSTLVTAVRQLMAYFDGSLKMFDLPLDLEGTTFQKAVWDELVKIPYGRTRSYREIAYDIGAPKAIRAVGAANGANPAPIVVPCHRVIGSSGKLVGYGGGLELKRRLLELEGCAITLF